MSFIIKKIFIYIYDIEVLIWLIVADVAITLLIIKKKAN